MLYKNLLKEVAELASVAVAMYRTTNQSYKLLSSVHTASYVYSILNKR